LTEPEEYQHPLGGPDWRYVPCNCGTAGHFIAFMPDPFDVDVVDIEFGSSRGGPWWHRLKWAVMHVFGREDLVFADAIVSRKRLVEVMNGLQHDHD